MEWNKARSFGESIRTLTAQDNRVAGRKWVEPCETEGAAGHIAYTYRSRYASLVQNNVIKYRVGNRVSFIKLKGDD